MKTYITFGQVHAHRVNGKTFDKDCVAVIEAPSEGAARELAFEAFDDKWAFSYPEKVWKEESLQHYPRGYITLEGPYDQEEK